MAKKDSVQKRLERVRPPRVQLSYDVEIGDAIENKELPFVMGVLGDFTGQADPNVAPTKLKERKFVNVDLDNFDEVLEGMAPRASYRVKNTLSAEGGEFAVNLEFKSLEDFTPESVVQQVDPLRQLLEARTKLSDLRNKLAGNDKLEDVLADVLSNTEKLKQLSKETATERATTKEQA
jgi:type VI secretion system protein ImpB